MHYSHRKCVTRCVPHDESFHQVWSWYNHPLPSIALLTADTLRDRVTLIFDLLVSGHTWRVTWSTPPPSLKVLRLSAPELWFLTSPIYRIPLTMRLHPLRMRRITWSMRKGQIFPTFEIPDPGLPIHYTAFMALRLRQMELSAKTVYSCRIFKLGGGIDHVTRHVWPLTKIKRSKVKVTRSRNLSAAITL